MFSVREIIGDFRSSVVSMITTGAVLFIASIAGAVWKSVKTQPVPWTFLILIGIAGIALLCAAIIKLVKADKTKDSPQDQASPIVQPVQMPMIPAQDFSDPAYDRFFQPPKPDARLILSCGAEIEGCVQLVRWGEHTWANYLRIKVETDSAAPVQNCTGFLTRIERNGEQKWGGNNVQLTFAHGDDPDTFSKTIRSNVLPEWLDVLAVSSEKEIRIASKGRVWRYPPAISKIFSEVGDYVLTVTVICDRVDTVTARLKFNWTQNWQTAALTLIPESPVQPAPKEQKIKVELQSDNGFICARVTNHSDSEVRIENVWIAVVDATRKTTLHKDRIRKFKRCSKMPYAMPPHSSFEATFSFSEGGFRSHALSPLAIAVKEYWIEVKLEDGTVIPSDHREIATDHSAAVMEVVNKTMLIIEANPARRHFPFSALREAGVGNLNTEEEFLAAREAIIQHNVPDPLIGLDDLWPVNEQPKWLAVIKLANQKQVALSSATELLDFINECSTPPS